MPSPSFRPTLLLVLAAFVGSACAARPKGDTTVLPDGSGYADPDAGDPYADPDAAPEPVGDDPPEPVPADEDSNVGGPRY